MLELSTASKLPEHVDDLELALDAATLSTIDGQTQTEDDIIEADGSYFIPVDSLDSGSLETDTMTVGTSSSDNESTLGIDGIGAFTEVSSTELTDSTDTEENTEMRDVSNYPDLEDIVELLEQQANSVDRRLSKSKGTSLSAGLRITFGRF